MYDECSRGDWAMLDELLAPKIIDHHAPPGLPPGRAGVKQFFTLLRAAFPALRFEVDQLIAKGDLVMARFTASATHSGTLLGMPATGRQVRSMVIDILPIANGRSVERWGMADMLGMMQQIGAMPAAQEATT